MRIRKAAISLFFSVILLSPVRMTALPPSDDLERVMRDNMALEERIRALNEQIAQLVDSASIGIGQLDDLRQRRDDSAERLRQLRESISRDSLNSLRSRHDEAARRYEASEREFRQLEEQRSALTDEYNQRKDELEAASALYGNDMLQRELDEANNYLDRQYSTMEVQRLDQLSEEAHRFSELPGFTAYVSKLNKATDRLDLYKRGQRAINSRYDAAEIADIRNILYPLTQKIPGEPGSFSAQQFEEMKNLDRALSRYRVGITKLHAIIEEVNQDPEVAAFRGALQSNSELPSNMNDYTFFTKIQSIVGDEGSHTEEIERYFQTIPFLGDYFYRYRIEIINSPVAWPGSVEREILDVLPLSLTR